MTIEVELPDGSIAEFPDDMPQEQITAVLQKQFPPKQVAPAKQGPASGAMRPAAVASQAAMEGGADVFDAILNTPNKIANMARIIPGVALQETGEAFDIPALRRLAQSDALQPRPDYPFVRQGLAALTRMTGGDPEAYRPQTQDEQRLATIAGVIGGTAAGGGVSPTTPLRSLVSAAGAGTGLQVAREAAPSSQLAELAGLVAGGASPAAFESLARGTGSLARSFFEPFTQRGQERIVGRALQQSEAIPGSIQSAQPSAVPGVQRTLAEATADPGVAQLQRATAMSDQPTGAAIDLGRRQSNAARIEALQKIAGDDATLSAAQKARDNAALKFLRSAVKSEQPVNVVRPVRIIDEMLAGRAGQRTAVAQALNDVKGKMSEVGGSVDLLYGVRQHIDDLMSGKVGGDQQGAGLARRYLTTVKKVLDREIVKAAPSFRKYLDVYKQGSIPVNQMELGREILRSATGTVDDPITGQLSLSPAKMGAAVKNMDQLAQRATGFKRAEAGRILSPEQQQTIRAVNEDLSRQNFVDTAARQAGSPTAQNLVGMNVLKQTLGPGGLGLPDAVVNSTMFQNAIANPANLLYRMTGAPEQVLDILRTALTNPTEARRLIAALPPKARNQVAAMLMQAMRQLPAEQVAAETQDGR